MDEPPVKIWVREANEWKYSSDWPLPETKYTDYYLRSNNLVEESPPSTEEAADSFKHKPVFPVTMGGTPLDPMPEYLSYATEPLNQDTEVIGHMALYLYASIATADADFIVKVKDVSPDGTEFVLSRGWLKASHREVDKEKSKLFAAFFQNMLKEGIYWPPSQFEAAFVSLAHRDEDVWTTIEITDKVLGRLEG